MSKRPLISIVIPCYNGFQTIERCLNSILRQDYDNFEVVIVDDGSTDDSYLVLETFATRDDRIKLYRTKNGGPSSARNFGIERASGDFVTFIDIDDEVGISFLSDFRIENAVSGCFIIQGMTEVFADNSVEVRFMTRSSVEFQSMSDGVSRCRLLHNGHSACKLYDLQHIMLVGARFDTKWRYKEDLMFCINYLQRAKNFMITNGVSYKYYHNVGSLTSKRYNIDYLLENSKCILLLLKELSFYNKISVSYLREYFSFCIQEQVEYLYMDNKMAKCEKIHFLKKIRDASFGNSYPRKYKSDTFLSILFYLRFFRLYNLIQQQLFKIRH